MLPIHVTLSHYKRSDVRAAMVAQCRGKEVAVKFTDHFGKRPGMLIHDNDILSFAQKKATSFHISEETWSNPMMLQPGMRRQEMNDLRTGWDLVLDIDFPEWEATKVITDALVRQLLEEGVPRDAITAKFSGNKGFHVAVPFEAFPDSYVDDEGNDVLISDFFPEGVRTMVEYLAHRADGPENGFALSEQLANMSGLETLQENLVTVDVKTGRRVKGVVSGNDFVCPVCEYRERSEKEYIECPKCGKLLRPVASADADEVRTRQKVDLNIDTMLVSARHMYRLVYSLHEKSGLVSVPVDPERILSFEKSAASPESFSLEAPFLRRDVESGCASRLLQNALQFKPPGEDERKEFTEVEWSGDAAPEELFPPAINKMLAGMDDGRKRALFVLTNFLRSVGWEYDHIEKRLHEWNDANTESLRENIIQQHLRYHKSKAQTVLPPNFDNDMYYKDLGMLVHDQLSERVKNPVQYVRLKMKRLKQDKKSS